METFPFFKVSGTAMERGRQIGQLAKEQIEQNIGMYKQFFLDGYQVTWEAAREYAASYIPWIEQYDQEIMDEIIGISEGAKLDVLDLVVLNARSEVMINIGKAETILDGCTCLVATPRVTRANETLLGQNWDWNHRIKPGMIMLEIEQAPRPTLLMVTEAGIVGKIGMNSEGLGVCLNFLGTSEVPENGGVPIHIILRGILNSKTLPQAIGQVARLPRGTSANYMIAHKEGETVDVESTPTNYDVIYPLEGYLAHANHFVGPRSILIDDTKRSTIPDTHLRHGIATRLLQETSGSIDAEGFVKIFTNHLGYPDSICRHGELFEPDLGRSGQSSTVFSIIMNLGQGTCDITAGQPCDHPYQSYRLG